MFKIKFMSSIVVLMMASMTVSADWEALPDVAPAPADNPTTDAKVELGKMLYMDPRFSSTGYGFLQLMS
jgi:cytochrome c peroxidase